MVAAVCCLATAAGADIKEMASKGFVDVYSTNMFANWGDITKITKPVGSSNAFKKTDATHSHFLDTIR